MTVSRIEFRISREEGYMKTASECKSASRSTNFYIAFVILVFAALAQLPGFLQVGRLFVVKKSENTTVSSFAMNPEVPTNPKKKRSMDGSDQVAVRQAKLDQMRENGFDPFRANWDQTHTSVEAKVFCARRSEEGPEVSLPGELLPLG